eukprot:m.81742 g.81742  ORF g.81742 m.81742 type:complete len:69 (+) comp8651_c0_seq2:2027-2233(+)
MWTKNYALILLLIERGAQFKKVWIVFFLLNILIVIALPILTVTCLDWESLDFITTSYPESSFSFLGEE